MYKHLNFALLKAAAFLGHAMMMIYATTVACGRAEAEKTITQVLLRLYVCVITGVADERANSMGGAFTITHYLRFLPSFW